MIRKSIFRIKILYLLIIILFISIIFSVNRELEKLKHEYIKAAAFHAEKEDEYELILVIMKKHPNLIKSYGTTKQKNIKDE